MAKQLVITSILLLVAFVGGNLQSTAGQSAAVNDDSERPAFQTLDEFYQYLAARRQRQLARLHQYTARQKFPQNTDFPEKLVPYFVDHAGTPCAVGHLMLEDGQESTVANIHEQCNHVRIRDVDQGPLVEWIIYSGLTHAECALIQPSYARIGDYRKGRQWQSENERLLEHFALVEQTLRQQSARSRGESLRKAIEVELLKEPVDPAFTGESLLHSLATSTEPAVRIGAAYALARFNETDLLRSVRIGAIKKNLTDPVAEVRFWTAVALQQIGAASSAGRLELHQMTLPVFMATFQRRESPLRFAALLQIAKLTPDCVGSGAQLRLVPELRRTMVEACDEKDAKVRDLARATLSSWRWQRIVYESDRMQRQYLADTHELESQVVESLLLGRPFVEANKTMQELHEQRAIYDITHWVLNFPSHESTQVMTADSAEQAVTVVREGLGALYKRNNISVHSPSSKFEPFFSDRKGMYYLIEYQQGGRPLDMRALYFVPSAKLLSQSNFGPSYWFKMSYKNEKYVWPAAEPASYAVRERVQVVLGDLARKEKQAFQKICDLFAYKLTHYALVLVDREVHETETEFIWSGRFASGRRHRSRFFEVGGGGWDFHRFTMTCDRTTGELTLDAEPIEFPLVQRTAAELEPEWRVEELQLMGWNPLEGLDFFGDQLLPPEYSEAVKLFQQGKEKQTREMLYQRNHIEKNLPDAQLVMGLLYEQAENREAAMRCMANVRSSNNPRMLADIARWEASVGLEEKARQDAEAALEIWPEYSKAQQVIDGLDRK